MPTLSLSFRRGGRLGEIYYRAPPQNQFSVWAAAGMIKIVGHIVLACVIGQPLIRGLHCVYLGFPQGLPWFLGADDVYLGPSHQCCGWLKFCSQMAFVLFVGSSVELLAATLADESIGMLRGEGEAKSLYDRCAEKV